jgi:FG-GAP-like repeat
MKPSAALHLMSSGRNRQRANPGPQKLAVALLTLIFAPGLCQVVNAQQIQFRPGELLQAASQALRVSSYAIPCVADWNGDGRKDLLVGYQTAGKIALYLNTGSDANPVFTTSVNLQAGGVDIYLPSGGCGAPAPWVCDYDNDGKCDLLVGDGASGYVYFYRNTNTDANPVLDTGVRLMVGSSPLTVTYRATPYLYDWDGDGLKDLLCGNGDGNVYFFRNIGTAQFPAYAVGTRLQAGGADLNLGIRSVVRVFDLDGDGVPDLLGSSNTGVYWCRNTGSRSAPVLALPVTLWAPVSGSGLQPIYTGQRMRLDWVDWNNDGVMDLLVGNLDGTISYFEGYRFGFTAITGRSSGPCVMQWNSASYLNYHVLAGSAVGSITNLVATNLPSGGKTTCYTNAGLPGQQFYRLQVAP